MAVTKMGMGGRGNGPEKIDHYLLSGFKDDSVRYKAKPAGSGDVSEVRGEMSF